MWIAPFDSERDVVFVRFATGGSVYLETRYASLALRGITDTSALPDRLLTAAAPARYKRRVATRFDFTGVPYQVGDEIVFPSLVPKISFMQNVTVTLIGLAEPEAPCDANAPRSWPASTGQ